MGLIQWIKDSWSGGKKDSRTASIITTPGSGGVIWTPRGYDNFARETYLKNVTAFRSISEIAMATASVPWSVFEHLPSGGRAIVPDDPMNDVLKRPNPNESLTAIILKATAYLVMSGNSFLERIKPDTGPNKDVIKELYALRPDRFKQKVNPTSGQLEKYVYTVQGRSTEWDVDPITQQADVLHLKSFHPLDDWWGAAPTESTAREIDTSNSATQWNKALLDNQGRPGMIFTLIGAVGEEAFDQLEERMQQRTGAEHVGKDLIITGERGTKAEPYGWSPTDMDFSEGDLRLMRKIAMGYGVPPMLLGIPGEATFANYKEAREAFYETIIFFYLNYIRGELNNWVYDKDSKLFLDYILDDIPAFAAKRNLLWKRSQESEFLTINEKREIVGFDQVDGGDVILVQSSMIPLGAGSDIDDQIDEEEEEDEEKLIQDLIDQGYEEDEIDQILGYFDPEEKGVDPTDLKPFPNEFSCRLNSPEKYDKFARVNCFQRSGKKCIDYIFGIKGTKSEVQALRYKKKIWSKSAAKTHCKDHGGSFE